ncbi:MAG: TrgA family protein [Defluviimonas sp.]|uniref:TrgA family protein n=1 Tax=Albidovulum sp. TaxID=1872424 RepID=UPI001D6EEF39|nr:TrgA family protein [Paracoccaceae bacterium]MCC0065388.1 TrgA family protein [Defluviimonas sp.]
MPTAAKLFAALAFAVLGFFAGEVALPHLPPGAQPANFSFYCMLIGLVCGWRVMGPAAGRGNLESVNAGVRTAAVMTLLALIIFSIVQMFILAYRHQFDGPMDAVVGIFGIAVNFGASLLNWDIMAVLLLGGVLGGLMAEWAARRWK